MTARFVPKPVGTAAHDDPDWREDGRESSSSNSSSQQREQRAVTTMPRPDHSDRPAITAHELAQAILDLIRGSQPGMTPALRDELIQGAKAAEDLIAAALSTPRQPEPEPEGEPEGAETATSASERARERGRQRGDEEEAEAEAEAEDDEEGGRG